MKLTQFTDYSLRVLMYLAVREDQIVSISDIAAAYGISENHLMKVVHMLGRHGLIHTARGRGGGLRLARPPEQICIGDVVRKTEPDFDVVECFDPVRNTCRIAQVCLLKKAFGAATRAFLETLDRYTLADLTSGTRSTMAQLLGQTAR